MSESMEEKQSTERRKFVITGMHMMLGLGVLSLLVHAVTFLFFDVDISWFGVALAAGIIAYSSNEIVKRKEQ